MSKLSLVVVITGSSASFRIDGRRWNGLCKRWGQEHLVVSERRVGSCTWFSRANIQQLARHSYDSLGKAAAAAEAAEAGSAEAVKLHMWTYCLQIISDIFCDALDEDSQVCASFLPDPS